MRRDRVFSAALSVALHAAVFAAIFWSVDEPAEVPGPAPVTVSLVEGLPIVQPPGPPAPAPPAPQPPAEAAPAKAEPAKAAKTTPAPPKPTPTPVLKARTTPAPRAAAKLAAAEEEEEGDPGPTIARLSEGEVAGAATASGSGGGGGGGGGGGRACNMVRLLENALRDDAEVKSAVRSAGAGRAVLVWNGQWLRNPGEAGKGLASVRQAISLEVAFAPESCRNDPVRGLVVIQLADAGRLALGRGSWRWSDLLELRR